MNRPHPTDQPGFLWHEEGERRLGVVAEVALTMPIIRTYAFAVPPSLEAEMHLGQRVLVPMGRRGTLRTGFVVRFDRQVWDATLRPVHSCVDSGSFLTPELIELGREISLHYACPLGRTLNAMTPEGVRRGRGLKPVRYVRLLKNPREIETAKLRMTPRRRAVIDHLHSQGGQAVLWDHLLTATGASESVLRALVVNGCVGVETRRELGLGLDDQVPQIEPSFQMNDAQAAALSTIRAAIAAAEFSVTLLFGVSGSGKTEVYIRAIRDVVASGAQAILLVPEIVLTTQLAQRLTSRFPRVAVVHSGLTEAHRSVMWRHISAGDTPVVIGTRSAVFAPCPKLGLICVDEEQETSYKNLQAPRFHVRDVAIMRAKRLRIAVVLGSATPSLETWYHSGHRKEYRRAVLPHRINDLSMPHVNIIDMRDEYAERKQTVVFSRTMERLLQETFQRGEQALLLINRRGFANRLFCPECKTRVTCPNCNVGMVVHTSSGQSVCHYCRARMTTPTTCPNPACSTPLVTFGVGTQQVEQLLAQLFPDRRVVRVDSDTMRHRSQYQNLINRFEARQIDALVGTQMIAKGLDFPFVSMVGVVHADSAPLGADFRAHERLFQLMTQVAGRAGRGDSPGHVVIQTVTPDLPAFTFALNHDYESFAEAELESRRVFGLPPFRRLARIVVAHRRDEIAQTEAEALAERIRGAILTMSLSRADVWGPAPCALARLRGAYRHEVTVRTATATDLRSLLQSLQQAGGLRTKADSTIVDVDPVAMA